VIFQNNFHYFSLKSRKLPIPTVTDPKKSDLAMLDNLINRAVFKIFKVSEKLVIYDIRHFLGLHDVASLCEMRRMKFLNKIRTLTHATLQSLTRQFY